MNEREREYDPNNSCNYNIFIPCHAVLLLNSLETGICWILDLTNYNHSWILLESYFTLYSQKWISLRDEFLILRPLRFHFLRFVSRLNLLVNFIQTKLVEFLRMVFDVFSGCHHRCQYAMFSVISSIFFAYRLDDLVTI